MLNPLKLLLRDSAGNDIGHCGFDDGLLVLLQKADTLLGAVRPLVELPRQEFHAINPVTLLMGEFLRIAKVHRRLRKHRAAGPLKGLLRQILHIVADQHPDSSDRSNAEIVDQVCLELLRLHRVGRLLFHVDPFYISHSNSFPHSSSRISPRFAQINVNCSSISASEGFMDSILTFIPSMVYMICLAMPAGSSQ